MAKVEDCPGFETFGADVKAARKARHLARKALAEMVGIEWRYNVGMMGFLYIEKRTCRMGQQPQQQVRFFLVRMYYGMTVHQEGWTIPLHGRNFFWPCTIRTQSAYFIKSNSLLLISSEARAFQRIKISLQT